MDTREYERIKNIISKAELDSAKAQGKIDSIKSNWKEKYGTDDLDEIKKIYNGYIEEIDNLEAKMEELYSKVKNSCDWNELERKLNG